MKQSCLIHTTFSQIAAALPEKIALQVVGDSYWKKCTSGQVEPPDNLTRFTYKEVEDKAKQIASFLIRQGYQKGACSALILDNSPEWSMIYLGLMYAGLICVAVDSESGLVDLEHIFCDCQPVICFTSSNIFKNKITDVNYPMSVFAGTNNANMSQKMQVVLIDEEDFNDGHVQDLSWPQIQARDVASLIYTSGTTAKPKGVALSHSNFCANFRGINDLNLCFPDDNFLSILPLHHTYAFMVTLLVPLFSGAKITYAQSFKPEQLTQIIKEASVTVLTGVPQLFSLIHNRIVQKLAAIPPLIRFVSMPVIKRKIRKQFGERLRLLVSGGARLQPQVAKGLSGLGFKVIEGYGLTETSPVATLNPPHRPKFGSVGKALPNTQVKIANPDTSGVGEVMIKGDNVMLGYFKRPQLTAQVKSVDGWFNSQDLGYLDKDNYLYLTGRKKDVIVLSSGKNIYPEELEEYYNQSPYIKEICIFEKITQHLGYKTSFLFAVIVPDFEYFRQKQKVNITEHIRWELENLSAKLPAYKRVMGFTISKQELPRTRLRKVKRFEVTKAYSDWQTHSETKELRLSPEDKGILESTLAKAIIEYLSSRLGRIISLSNHLELDLGIDSLSRIELCADIEAILSMSIPQDLINRALTVKELILAIRDLNLEAELPKQQKKTWAQILNQMPPEDITAKIQLNPGPMGRFLTYAFSYICRFIFKVFFSLKVTGREFVPEEGPYIFCPNHASYLDGFLLFSSIRANCALKLFFIGHANIFEHFLIRWAIKIARLISIDPLTHLTQSLQAASFVLKEQKVICIFPEGVRSIDGNVQDFKKGVGILAKELDVALIPVCIEGTQLAWGRTKIFPRPYPVKITFGKPLNSQVLGNDPAAITEVLRQKVLELKTTANINS